MIETEDRLKSGGAEITHLRQEYTALQKQFEGTKVTLETKLQELTVSTPFLVE